MRPTIFGHPRSHPAARVWAAVFVLAVATAGTPPCSAQAVDTTFATGADSADVRPQALAPQPYSSGEPHEVRWWEAAAVGGGVGALLADDRHVLHDVREHPTSGAGDVADVFRQAGNVKVYTALTLGTLGVGLLAGNGGITRTGEQLAASGVLAAASVGLLKVATGRSRPDEGQGAYDFRPFTAEGSFPSGHSALAFAMATTLGDASHSIWVKAGLYLIATGTAWSRVYDERHWPSDVLMGSALGVTSAKLVNGHWRIFHLRSPAFLVSPNAAGLRMTF